MGKKKKRNFQTKQNQYKGISKKAAVFDDEERKQYLQSMIGAKKRRKEEYIKMKNEKTKKQMREQKHQLREEKKQSIQRLQELIMGNQNFAKVERQERVITDKNDEVKVTTTFFE